MYYAFSIHRAVWSNLVLDSQHTESNTTTNFTSLFTFSMLLKSGVADLYLGIVKVTCVDHMKVKYIL